jgi:hypothetical protein
MTQQSILDLFKQRYKLLDKIEYTITYRTKTLPNEKGKLLSVHTEDYITIEDVIINARRNTIAFKIQLRDIYLNKRDYGDRSGRFLWDIHEVLAKKYLTLFKYLGQPKIVVHVTNENEIPDIQLVRLTL